MIKKVNKGFRIDPRHPAAVVAVIAFSCCIPSQILGYREGLNNPYVTVTLVILPVLSASLMIAVILLFGRNALWLSVLPVCIGVLAFAFKLSIDPHGTGSLHHFSAVVLYIMIIVLWTLTVLYIIRTKWVLVMLFLIPFIKHVFVDVVPVLMHKTAPLSFSSWMKEFSMLFFMLALFFCALSFEDSNY